MTYICTGYPQGHFEQTAPVAAPAAPMAGQPVIPLPPNGQPASYAPPPFLVPPPQFIPPQTAPPSIINYVPGPNGPAFQPNFQGYQSYTPPVQVNFIIRIINQSWLFDLINKTYSILITL